MKLPALPVGDALSTLNFERLAASVEPASVTSLPVSPRDGQVIDFVADATAGVVWRLRYRAASASAYKWEFVGGSALSAEMTANGACSAANGFTNALTANNISVVAPLAGVYDVEASSGFALNDTAGQNVSIGSVFSGETAGSPFVASLYCATANLDGGPLRHRRRGTYAAAGATVQPIYNTSGGTANFYRNRIEAVPVRVG